MEKNSKLLNKYQNKGIVLFDGYCNLCSWSVQFIIKRDSKDYFRFASLQSEFAIELLYNFDLPDNFDSSVILIEKEKIYFKSAAVLRIVKRLRMFWKYLYYFICFPRFFRDFIYDFIAKNRFRWFGRKKVCYVPNKNISNKFIS